MTGELSDREILVDLAGILCAGCGGPKMRRRSFCIDCYHALPKELQRGIWRSFNHGYQPAFLEARTWLRAKYLTPSP